jgi:hypothetical protein
LLNAYTMRAELTFARSVDHSTTPTVAIFELGDAFTVNMQLAVEPPPAPAAPEAPAVPAPAATPPVAAPETAADPPIELPPVVPPVGVTPPAAMPPPVAGRPPVAVAPPVPTVLPPVVEWVFWVPSPPEPLQLARIASSEA